MAPQDSGKVVSELRGTEYRLRSIGKLMRITLILRKGATKEKKTRPGKRGRGRKRSSRHVASRKKLCRRNRSRKGGERTGQAANSLRIRKKKKEEKGRGLSDREGVRSSEGGKTIAPPKRGGRFLYSKTNKLQKHQPLYPPKGTQRESLA